MSKEMTNELEILKQRAKQLGISFSPNIGVEALKAKINAVLKEDKEEPKEENQDNTPLSKAQLKAKLRREAGKLVRVRVTCMNPNKKEWEGEIISAGNSVVGQFKKYIPFNVAWHVPQIILNYMKEKQCQIFKTVRNERGEKVKKGKLIPEYSIEILPPLTEKELKELARQQAMKNGTDEE